MLGSRWSGGRSPKTLCGWLPWHLEQVVSCGKGREIRQSRIDDPVEGKTMLLRAVVEQRQGPLFVVTAYKTSKIEKYWQTEVNR
jgi:hypothetical protein